MVSWGWNGGDCTTLHWGRERFIPGSSCASEAPANLPRAARAHLPRAAILPALQSLQIFQRPYMEVTISRLSFSNPASSPFQSHFLPFPILHPPLAIFDAAVPGSDGEQRDEGRRTEEGYFFTTRSNPDPNLGQCCVGLRFGILSGVTSRCCATRATASCCAITTTSALCGMVAGIQYWDSWRSIHIYKSMVSASLCSVFDSLVQFASAAG